MIAAAHTALVGLFPSRTAQLDESYEHSIAALSDDGDGGESRARHSVGIEVGMAVLAWRSADGFNATYPPFRVDSLSVNGARHLRLSAQ